MPKKRSGVLPGCSVTEHEIFLVDSISDHSLAEVMRQMVEIQKQDKDALIDLWIKTDGGDFSAVPAFLDFVRLRRVNLVTTAFGDVGSSGVFLFGAGKRRRAAKLSEFIFHQVSLGFDSDESLNLSELNPIFGHLKELHNFSIDFLVELYKIKKKLATKLINKKKRLTAHKMLELGMVHEVL